MRIAVLGATGRTGRAVVSAALDAGHEIVAYVRRPEAVVRADGVRAVGGALDDVDAMAAALTDCDAVAVALGTTVTRPMAPVLRTAMPAVIEACRVAGVRRVIVLSALGVGETLISVRFPYRLVVRTALLAPFHDHVAGEGLLAGSGLEWTTIHPGLLGDGAATTDPVVVDAATRRAMPGWPRTERADVAAVMLRVIDDGKTFGRRLIVLSGSHAS
ncbi:NAD(P)-dependent oxidoreductase [Microbacterium bovistercoris]|uniref:NAD(P)-dependent oxidoreductase n=1 Tax=Microbacterium bovistercoris TaxID=2293570 RepID=A0A371NZ32_9MICO|nr:NAD(P)-binding oxidoreductase [Microbacterium bovistercoris]REJ08514.1 NAD(P)-dependent oxidoreductase [Microbacterium bovistercoris]